MISNKIVILAIVKLQAFTCEGFLLSKVPGFMALAKLLATTQASAKSPSRKIHFGIILVA